VEGEYKAALMEGALVWLEEEERQQQAQGEREEQQEWGVKEDFDIMMGDVVASEPPSTQINTATPTNQSQIDDARTSSGKRAITFSYKRGRGN
jgi:hypothetical protein